MKLIDRFNSAKKIILWGYGRSNQAVHQYLCANTNKKIMIVGPRGMTAETHLSNASFASEEDLLSDNLPLNSSFVIVSPGIDHRHPLRIKWQKQEVCFCNEISLSYEFVKQKFHLAKFIGITGSNGKTTTATLTKELLKKSGHKVFLGGNIGIPLIEALTQKALDFIVLELSSFQLQLIHQLRLDIALLTNFSPTHQERYDSINEYLKDKLNILLTLDKDSVFYYTKKSTLDFKLPKNINSKLIDLDQELEEHSLEFKEYKLPGVHNQYNLLMSYYLTKRYLKEGAFKAVMTSFKGIPHRLEYFSSSHMECFNDSKSTNLFSTETALNAFYGDNRRTVLLIGGKLRYDIGSIPPSMLKTLDSFENLTLSFFGEAKASLAKSKLGEYFYLSFNTLDKALEEVKKSSKEIELLIFSPGFPSFDEFKNFEERGDFFKETIKRI